MGNTHFRLLVRMRDKEQALLHFRKSTNILRLLNKINSFKYFISSDEHSLPFGDSKLLEREWRLLASVNVIYKKTAGGTEKCYERLSYFSKRSSQRRTTLP